MSDFELLSVVLMVHRDYRHDTDKLHRKHKKITATQSPRRLFI